MTPASRPKRPFGLGTYVLLLVGVAAVAGLASVGHNLIGGQSDALDLALTAALMAVTMAVAMAASVWWWRGIDEAAREAHKWAWWWGGTGGTAIGAIILIALTVRDDPAIPGAVGPGAAELVAGGMVAILLFQTAGYAVAWAVWWLKHR